MSKGFLCVAGLMVGLMMVMGCSTMEYAAHNHNAKKVVERYIDLTEERQYVSSYVLCSAELKKEVSLDRYAQWHKFMQDTFGEWEDVESSFAEFVGDVTLDKRARLGTIPEKTTTLYSYAVEAEKGDLIVHLAVVFDGKEFFLSYIDYYSDVFADDPAILQAAQ